MFKWLKKKQKYKKVVLTPDDIKKYGGEEWIDFSNRVSNLKKPLDINELIQLQSDIERLREKMATSKIIEDSIRKHWISKGLKKKPKQTCSCYCPECRNELIGSNSFVSDEEYVTYKCSECGYISCWNFDMPVPVLLRRESVAYQVKDVR